MRSKKYTSLNGFRFFSLLVTSEPFKRGADYYHKCFCDCGKECAYKASDLRLGKVKTCGNRAIHYSKHGHAGDWNNASKTYRIWWSMKQRCENKNASAYSRYGGRGIKVCEKWQDFREFLKDMGEQPIGMTIERENNDGDYEPVNCRWATRWEQSRNQRRNINLTFNGKTMCLTDWAIYLEIPYGRLKSRWRYGWRNPEHILQIKRFERRKYIKSEGLL